MRAQHRRAATGSALLRLAFVSLVVIGCLVIPVGTAFSQTATVTTGTITCKEVYLQDGAPPPATVVYNVVMTDTVVAGRWGTGNDINYEAFYGGGTETAGTSYMYWMSDPHNLETYESLYSETARLDYKVTKGRTLNVKGRSFAIIDMNLGAFPLTLTADCIWNLAGALPPL